MLHKQNFSNTSLFSKLMQLENKVEAMQVKIDELEKEIKETKEMRNQSLSCSTFSDPTIDEFNRNMKLVVSYDMLELE
jgi:peptidoglycan hydrolase CwlO-like protein